MRRPSNRFIGHGAIRCRCLLFLLVSLACALASTSNHQEARVGPVSHVGIANEPLKREGDEGEENDGEIAIDSILSRIASWKDKRKKAKAKHEEDPEKHLPFVTLAYAQTIDGKIAATTINDETTTSNLRLSCEESSRLTHRLRQMHDGILIGSSTFLIDEPRLSARIGPSSERMEVDQPRPIVLDTNLKSLQKLLFGKVIDALPSKFPDLVLNKIRAKTPVICCSTTAAQRFLDVLEIFQEELVLRRKAKYEYKITVYKKIDDEDDGANDAYLPVKITIKVTSKNSKQEEEQELTLTLLPCRVNEEVVDLPHALNQLYQQFAIDSLLVEGGAGILSSFLKYSNCVCATMAPKIGGRKGLSAFGSFDAPGERDGVNSADKNDTTDAAKRLQNMKDCSFTVLGSDCIFLGRPTR